VAAASAQGPDGACGGLDRGHRGAVVLGLLAGDAGGRGVGHVQGHGALLQRRRRPRVVRARLQRCSLGKCLSDLTCHLLRV